jgi:hypothetical protein
MVVFPLGALLAYLNFPCLNDGGERLLTNPTVIQTTCRASRDGGRRPPARYGCKEIFRHGLNFAKALKVEKAQYEPQREPGSTNFRPRPDHESGAGPSLGLAGHHVS